LHDSFGFASAARATYFGHVFVARPVSSVVRCSPAAGLSVAAMVANRVNLTCRVEAFNLLNRVQFGPPNTQASTAASNTFGKVTTQ
jgi:hypothetical protein